MTDLFYKYKVCRIPFIFVWLGGITAQKVQFKCLHLYAEQSNMLQCHFVAYYIVKYIYIAIFVASD